ncbi:4-diphosphocytidyl-2-C-methyl-D-erythritol kinase [Clostridiaceae bacterium JG1575]|nr:4-diphosphocytidyl-2-C-methyl-D-erythritol kinase [Clostridiaceae bacterium JG1575]
MHVKAFAKINLFLHVVGRRPDGYHLLDMVMQEVDLCDELTLNLQPPKKRRKDQEASRITVYSSEKFLKKGEENLVLRAAQAYYSVQEETGEGRIDLYKAIPVAAGLGGGSADAAAVLRALNEQSEHPLSDEDLSNLACHLGADVPFFLQGGTVRCQGIGEILTPLTPFSGHRCLLVNPGFAVETPKVFGRLQRSDWQKKGCIEPLLAALARQSLEEVSALMANDLARPTFEEHPELQKIEEALLREGALGAAMSGSGPTMFGFFDKEEPFQAAYEALKKDYPLTFRTRTR